MKNVLGIVGASGHGKVLADIALACGISDIVFFDDDANKAGLTHYGFPVVGPLSVVGYDTCEQYIVAIGNNVVRQRVQRSLVSRNCHLTSLIHPFSCVSPSAQIGEGVVVMPGAVINACVQIGDGCIVNTGSSVDHDCLLGKFCHISPGVHLAGSVKFGDLVWAGIGAIVINNISVAPESIIGAGSVVVDDIVVSGTYVGVPAKRQLK